jgi:hypothetical protein
MISYKVERVDQPFLDQWSVIAIFGNRLEWEVARYNARGKAEDRVKRMEEMRKAEAAS